MHELMTEGNPGMARMHELMTEGNPGMARMHELMTEGAPPSVPDRTERHLPLH